MQQKFRTVIFYKDYFENFYLKQNRKVQAKILWTIELLEDVQNIPIKFLKHISDTEGLYEIRVSFKSEIFRVFCFFDKGKIIVLMNGFQKKKNKTPKKEIIKALKIKKEYEQEK